MSSQLFVEFNYYVNNKKISLTMRGDLLDSQSPLEAVQIVD